MARILCRWRCPASAAARLGAPLQRLRSRRLARASHVARRREGRFRSRLDAELLHRRPPGAGVGRAPSARHRPPVTPASPPRRRRLREISPRWWKSSNAGASRASVQTAASTAKGEQRASYGRIAPNARSGRTVTSLPPAPTRRLAPSPRRFHHVAVLHVESTAATLSRGGRLWSGPLPRQECCCGTAWLPGV